MAIIKQCQLDSVLQKYRALHFMPSNCEDSEGQRALLALVQPWEASGH